MSRLGDLLERGFLPRELPPTFNSETFSNLLTRKGALPRRVSRNTSRSELLVHSLARSGTLRRRLGIPNPVRYAVLSEELVDSWRAISRKLGKSSISRSRPLFHSGVGRAVLPARSLGRLVRERARARVGKRYGLRTDISRFYGSVYTHSIPWALHGKARAKKDHSDALVGNRLDRKVRSAQHGQTTGIPIGPDTSLVLAELVLCAVDRKLETRLGQGLGFRHMDDYELTFRTVAEAEDASAVLQELLSEYELELNPAKTEVFELPVPLEAPWVDAVRSAQLRKTRAGQAGDLLRVFDIAFEFASKSPDEPVLRYAVARFKATLIHPANWSLFQDLLFQCLLVEPGTIAEVAAQLRRHEARGYELDRQGLETTLSEVIDKHAPLGHGHEVAWSLWTLVSFGVGLDQQAVRALGRSEDPVVALLALEAHRRGLVKALPTESWQSHMTRADLWGPQWLLAYEAEREGFLPSAETRNHVDADPLFRLMKDKRVRFFDSKRFGLLPTGVAPTIGLAPAFSAP